MYVLPAAGVLAMLTAYDWTVTRSTRDRKETNDQNKTEGDHDVPSDQMREFPGQFSRK